MSRTIKKKILLISDNMTCPSGVAVQSQYLALGLAATEKYRVVQLGAMLAIPGPANTITQFSADVSICPMVGFDNLFLYRKMLLEYQPDVCILFHDPRFFQSLFSIHDEVHQVCPIIYWHLWDNCDMSPDFHRVMYDIVDQVNCINYDTYCFVKTVKENAEYIPHGLTEATFYPLQDMEITRKKQEMLPGRAGHFVLLYVSRSAPRKRAPDVLLAFKSFLEEQAALEGKPPRATLVMHLNPNDPAGAPLIEITTKLGLSEHVVFSARTLSESEMNSLYNIADCMITIPYAEGFGLSTLHGLFCGVPMIANATGGLKRQVRNPYTNFVHGVELVPDRMLVGSIKDGCPYILQDMARMPDIVRAIQRIYRMDPSERKRLGQAGREYALREYSLEKMIADWDRSIETTLHRWRSTHSRWRATRV